MSDELRVSDWVKRFPGVTEAAAALGVSRVTLWRWSNEGDVFPGAWEYKAKGLPKKRRQAAQDRAGDTNAADPDATSP